MSPSLKAERISNSDNTVPIAKRSPSVKDNV